MSTFAKEGYSQSLPSNNKIKRAECVLTMFALNTVIMEPTSAPSESIKVVYKQVASPISGF